jgi:hypothetical protein
VARITGYRLLGGLSVVLAIFLSMSSVAAASTGGNRVKAELRQADEALGNVWQEAEDEDADDTYDLGAVAANLAHTEAARQLAVKLTSPDRAKVLAAVNDQADDNVYEYADDAYWAPVDQQPAFADALAQSVAVRSAVTGAILVKAEKLAPGIRAAVLRSVGDALSDGDPDTLLESLSDPEGMDAATQGALVSTLGRILADTDETLGELQRLAGRLPKRDRGKVLDTIEEIQDSLDELPDWVDELLADIADFADDPGAATAAFCAVLAGLPLPAPSVCG